MADRKWDKLAGKGGRGLQFYTNFSSVAKYAQLKKKSTKKLGKTLTVWFSKEGGFMFNKAAAENLSNYLKVTLASQDPRVFGTIPPPGRKWAEKKAQLGLDSRTGIATGAALDAIQPISTGGSEWQVGIPKGSSSGGIGKISDIATYMMYLEKGRSNNPPEQYQPPRPWFGQAFMLWTRETLPKLIRNTFKSDLEKHIAELGMEARGAAEQAVQVKFGPTEKGLGSKKASVPDVDVQDKTSIGDVSTTGSFIPKGTEIGEVEIFEGYTARVTDIAEVFDEQVGLWRDISEVFADKLK